MADLTKQHEGAVSPPKQQELPSTTEPGHESPAGTRALLLPVDDTDVSIRT